MHRKIYILPTLPETPSKKYHPIYSLIMTGTFGNYTKLVKLLNRHGLEIYMYCTCTYNVHVHHVVHVGHVHWASCCIPRAFALLATCVRSASMTYTFCRSAHPKSPTLRKWWRCTRPSLKRNCTLSTVPLARTGVGDMLVVNVTQSCTLHIIIFPRQAARGVLFSALVSQRVFNHLRFSEVIMPMTVSSVPAHSLFEIAISPRKPNVSVWYFYWTYIRPSWSFVIDDICKKNYWEVRCMAKIGLTQKNTLFCKMHSYKSA